jgi:phage shock protein C
LALANNMNADPTLIRVLWVVLSLMTALIFGVVAYFVAWILIPEEPEVVVAPNRQPTEG